MALELPAGRGHRGSAVDDAAVPARRTAARGRETAMTRPLAPNRWSPTGASGLTSDEVRARLAEHGPNALPRAARPSLARRLAGELREPMAVLLIAAAAISGIVLEERIDAIAIVTIVVVNAIIALAQEGRAERAMASLEELEAPAATVVRDGRPRRLPATQLVPGDVVLLQTGDRIPADLDLTATSALETDESMLTGESLPVAKRAGGTTDRDTALGDRDGAVFSGTLVTRGTGAGTATATGSGTQLGAIAAHLRDIRREPTPLQRHLAGLTRRLGLAAVVIAGGTFGLLLLAGRSQSVDEAFLTAVALAVAAVPEGLAAVTTVALALGVGRMARRGAIVRRLPAVETLGATDVLVIDKTGTVTENRMRASVVVAPDGTVHPADELPGALAARLAPILALCNDAGLDPPVGDAMERALLALVGAEAADRLRGQAPRLGGSPFTSERKRMSSVHRADRHVVLLAKGAPETVLARCGWRAPVAVAGTGPAGAGTTDTPGTPLDDDGREHLAAIAASRARRGERVLALASRILDDVPGDEEVEGLEDDLVLEALVTLRDPPRASAASSVAAIREAGVTLLMATGDHPATASAIADEIGLATTTARTGTELRRDGLPTHPTEVPVFARVDPDQKLELVDRLQELGHTVAMTGDGVNDAPALRSADIGVALGASGSDVAREAADLVVTDDDLATIVAAIREGRGIYDNLRKVIDYLVAANLSEVMVVLAALALLPVLGVPLLPLQLLWINLLTDGLPALALGVDPVDPGLMRRPPRPREHRLLDRAHLGRLASRAVVLAVAALGALLAAHHLLGLPPAASRTVLFTTLVLAQTSYAFVVHRGAAGGGARPTNRWLVASAALAVVLHVTIVVTPGAQVVFDTVALTPAGWAVSIVAGLAAPLAIAVALGRGGR